MTSDLISGALVDEPAAHECRCTCGCMAVASSGAVCEACSTGDCLWPEDGGEG